MRKQNNCALRQTYPAFKRIELHKADTCPGCGGESLAPITAPEGITLCDNCQTVKNRLEDFRQADIERTRSGLLAGALACLLAICFVVGNVGRGTYPLAVGATVLLTAAGVGLCVAGAMYKG